MGNCAGASSDAPVPVPGTPAPLSSPALTGVRVGGFNPQVQEQIMSDLTLIPSNAVEISGARTFTTSLMVAGVFEKRHADVLRDIDGLISACPADFHERNFAFMVRDVQIGSGAVRQDRYCELSKDGFTLLAMGYTGAKAMQFKLAYIQRFNAMEAQLQGTVPLAPGQRWLVHVDQTGNLIFNPVDPQAFFLPARDWPGVIKTPDFPRELLPQVLEAVGERMKALGGVAISPRPIGDAHQPTPDATLKIQAFIRDRGATTMREISRKFRTIKKKERDEIILSMVNQGSASMESKTGCHRPSVVVRWLAEEHASACPTFVRDSRDSRTPDKTTI
jgi:Rha family phage regulatory protein